ncbi:MAG: hypothetical protein F6K39_41980 [Okeania sp. SIO3B3]|nr:hypothetical protein [Okeania sp. SIO3B3]
MESLLVGLGVRSQESGEMGNLEEVGVRIVPQFFCLYFAFYANFLRVSD